jgi:Glycosyltransferase family 87
MTGCFEIPIRFGGSAMWLEANAVRAVVVIALTMVLFAKGIVPAMSKLDTDFPNYLTAATIVADGGPADRLYDTSWFQEQMRRYRIGVPSEGKFSPFPPPTALLLLPLTRLQPIDALRVVTLCSLLSLIVSIVLLAKVLSWRLLDTAIFVLLSGYAVVTGLRFGQPYILVSLSCILGYYAYLERRPLLAGICFGLFAPIKYFSVPLLAYFAFRKQGKLALSGVMTILLVAVASIVTLGWRIHASFLSILGNHLVGRLAMQDPFTATFQSFDTLFRRLFIFDSTSNPLPLWSMPGLQAAGTVVTKLALCAAALATLVKLARNGIGAVAPSIGILGILTLLLAPATATYHFALLWLPVGLLIQFALQKRATGCAYFILGTYALIGVFPYGLTAGFEGRGGLSVLAYPRLWLLLAMFMACLFCVWRRGESVRGAEASGLPGGVAGAASP